MLRCTVLHYCAVLRFHALPLLPLLQSNTAQTSVTNQNGIGNAVWTTQTALPIQIATIKESGG